MRTTTTTKKKSSIVNSFIRYNKEQSTHFTSPEETLRRRQYRAKNPVEIAAMKCMDGRLNMATITGSPLGIIQPYRDLGAMFDVGAHFGELLSEWVNRAIKDGKDCIVLVTYHWSKGEPERGCKGFNCNVNAARRYTAKTLEEIEEVFGARPSTVYPIQVGIETDEDALVLHGTNGQELDLAGEQSDDRETLRIKLEKLFPGMTRPMLESLLNICIGNIHHIAHIRKVKRSVVDIDHKENIIAVGRGFDWFHELNRMLIVGPYSFDMANPIAIAGKIILNNLKTGKIPKREGFALITSAVYRDEAGPEKIRAAKKAQSLMMLSLKTLEREVPELMKYMEIGAGILNENTRLFTLVDLKEVKN